MRRKSWSVMFPSDLHQIFADSDLSGNVTGAQWVIDGGRTATGGAATSAMQK